MRRIGLGELPDIITDQSDVATTSGEFQTRPIENTYFTTDIVDQSALLQRPGGDGDATPTHPKQGGKDFMG